MVRTGRTIPVALAFVAGFLGILLCVSAAVVIVFLVVQP
jgi:hypothetical protein